MILRPYRRIRALQQEVDTLRCVRDALYRVVYDERRHDLRDAIALMGSMHQQLTRKREELDDYDAALRALAEGQRRLGVGQ